MPKYKATATLRWEFEAEDQAAASKQFNAVLDSIEMGCDDCYLGYSDTELEEGSDAKPSR